MSLQTRPMGNPAANGAGHVADVYDHRYGADCAGVARAGNTAAVVACGTGGSKSQPLTVRPVPTPDRLLSPIRGVPVNQLDASHATHGVAESRGNACAVPHLGHEVMSAMAGGMSGG